MANIGIDALKDKIDEKIVTNGEQEITAAVLNDVLQDSVDTLAENVSVSQNTETGHTEIKLGDTVVGTAASVDDISKIKQEINENSVEITMARGGASAGNIPIIIAEDGKFVFWNGSIEETPNSFISKPIKVFKGVQYTYRGTAYNNLFAVVCTCDSEGGNITPVVQSSATGKETKDYTYTPNADGYILVCGYKSEYALSYTYTTIGEIPTIKTELTKLNAQILQRTQGEDIYNGYIYPIVLIAGVTYYIKHISGDLSNIYTDNQDAVSLITNTWRAFTPNNTTRPLTYFPNTKVQAPVIEIAWGKGVYNEIVTLESEVSKKIETSKVLQRVQGLNSANGYYYPLSLIAGETYYIKHISGDKRNIYTDGNDAVSLITGKFVAFTPNNTALPLTYFPDTKVEAPVIEVAWGDGVYNEIKSLSEDIAELQQEEIGKGLKKYAGIQRIGFLNNPNLFGADYLFVPVYGQSFTTSYDGGYKITDSYDSNVYMLGNWPTGHGTAVINPMSTGNYEYFVADFADIFSRLLKTYTWKDQKIVAQSFGAGERSVMELSPDNGYGDGWHTYEDTFEPGVHNAAVAAQNENKTIAVPFVLYLQGESDLKLTRGQSATADSWCKGDKALYKQYMSALKTSMQNTIMSETGQTEPPLVIVYTAGNVSFNSRECGIQQAVLELCAENDDMFCVGPYYQLPEMGPHLTPDGRRWHAELFAKQVFELLVRGEETSIYPEECYVENNNVVIRLKVPTPPLVFDTWTTDERTNKGFFLWEKQNGAIVNSIGISSVAIVEDDTIVITPSGDISNKNVFVTYGNSNCNGGGNLRDSGKWLSHYDYESNNNGGDPWPAIIYIPLDKDGQTLIGKKYPMQMWCPQFGIDII